jgi:peptidoglycan/xylan/chitin deacetylase (PgdA/CDA1 family)
MFLKIILFASLHAIRPVKRFAFGLLLTATLLITSITRVNIRSHCFSSIHYFIYIYAGVPARAQENSSGANHAQLPAAPTGPPPLAKKRIPELHVNSWRGNRVVKLWRGDPNGKEVALTFDDGPHPAYTLRLLDLLRELHVRATFFVVGKKVDEAPWLLPRMLADGHEVGNHTYNHLNLDKADESFVMNEIRQGQDAIQRASGIKTFSFRPPGGHHNVSVLAGAEKMNCRTFLWTDDPADFANPGAAVIEQRLIGKVTSGAIVLLHDGIEQTLEILPDLIARLKGDGYHFVTVTELAEHLEASGSGR